VQLQEIFQQFITGFRNATWVEYIAIITGIASVWFSRLENIWVYPIGLVSTVSYVFLSFKYQLFGEATVNLYYTAMSIYGWMLWAKRDQQEKHVVKISFSSRRELRDQFLFFGAFYVVFYTALTLLQQSFSPGTIPFGDALATATAFTGMLLMARKKVESWYWWLATNTASVPLYFVKGLTFTSVFYIVLFIMAIFGLIEWRKRAKENHA
jgi:nicotinamide mononucleotide transporter